MNTFLPFISRKIIFALIFITLLARGEAATLFSGFNGHPQGNSIGGIAYFDTDGYSFQVGTNNLQVFRIWNMDTSGLTTPSNPDNVGIWDSSGNLLVSETFTNTNNSIYLGGSYLASPITLYAGDIYTIGAGGGEQSRFTLDNSSSPFLSSFTSPDVTFLSGVRNSLQGVFSQPTNQLSNFSWTGMTFEYNVVSVPEPSSYALISLGGLALAFSHRRRVRGEWEPSVSRRNPCLRCSNS